ncbi:PKD domain-containing protein [Pseudofulvibacter geojedonensis]|uniref:PKD domain-containing protein n=1 Tax=Pseudofulvibacter geojedonensis TaxID=1123758 RepID=A0ABW3I0Z5_9FLAO
MKHIYIILMLISIQILIGQESKNVLFLGNSYTTSNNLPSLIQQTAASVGDTFTFDSNTPGGYRLKGHASNTTSINKIQAGNWDYVVLQEQSQFPSFPDAQVETEVYPYATQLSNLIKQHNPCASTTFYMTWGRENGDAGNCSGWPPVCTYEGMDDLLRQRYQTMANNNNGITSPVGVVWRYLRTNHPTLDLYSGDGSHPSLTGSYAGAITFYCTIFRKDPTLVTFNSTLNAADADIIKNAVKEVVFNDFSEWNIGKYDPVANFTYTNTDENYTFNNTSDYGVSYLWDFGDGNTSTDENPNHTYTSIGNFTITLTTSNCGKISITSQDITITSLNIEDNQLADNNFYLVENPVSDYIKINSNLFILKKYQFRITNTIGQVVIKTNSNLNSSQEINISNLSNGLYILNIFNEDQKVFKVKILKD